MKTVLMKTSLSDGRAAKRQYTVPDEEADKLIEVGFADLVVSGEPDTPPDVPPEPEGSSHPEPEVPTEPAKSDGKSGKRS